MKKILTQPVIQSQTCLFLSNNAPSRYSSFERSNRPSHFCTFLQENQKVEHNSLEMKSNSQFIVAIHFFRRFHHPIHVLRTDFSDRFFRRTDNTSARNSAKGDLFDLNEGFPRCLPVSTFF